MKTRANGWKKTGSLSICAGVVLCSMGISTSPAQNLLTGLSAGEAPRFSFTYMRPSFADEMDISTLSGIYDLSLAIPVSPGLRVVASAPFLVAEYEHEEDSRGIGNIYCGLEHCHDRKNGTLSTESIGVFFPTVDDETHNWFGYYTDYSRQHKYLSKTWTVSGNYAYRHVSRGGGLLGFQVGPDVWIPTDGDHRDAEMLLHYGIQGGFASERLALTLEVVGLALVTEDWDRFSDLAKHAAVLGAQWNIGQFYPGAFYQLYLDGDLRDMVSGTFGLKLDFVPE